MPFTQQKTVAYQLARAARAHRAVLSRRLEQLGLFPGQERVIDYLSAHDRASIGEMSQALGVKPPTISKSITRLAEEQLVLRAVSEGDSRVVLVTLTEKGQALAQQLASVLLDVEAELADALGEKDARRLRKLLRSMSRALEKVDSALDLEADEQD